MGKNTVVVGIAGIAVALLLTGCGLREAAQAAEQQTAVVAELSHEDGTYRGSFIDKGEINVSVEFKLSRDVVTEAKYRFIQYDGKNCLESPWGPQYLQALEYLVGKDIRTNLDALYQPGDFVDDVDGFSGATIRSNKVRSAMQDALNRGAYSR